MNMEMIIQYITYALMAVGVLAFVVAAIVQGIKELPGLQRIPTSVVALVVSVIVCLLVVVIICQCSKIIMVWYHPVGAVIAAFIVYLVATGGWERISEIWNRTKYRE